jgi:ribonucleoside-triphosphate reductase (thioredoxin)
MQIIDSNGALIDPYKSFIATSRYSRWNDDLGRRETWVETVNRYVNYMHDSMEKNYPKAISESDWDRIHAAILNHKVMPSMRALMTAGPALDRSHVSAYNCSFIPVDSPRSFDEALFILMNGTGLGFSAERKYTQSLPIVNEHFENTNTVIKVADSKEGWARALRELIAMLYVGQIPAIDITALRPAGARLKTFGGRSSGPQPLVNLFGFVIETFKAAAGRQLSSLECHDIMCKIGEVVVVGGVRRSALISLQDLDDYDMAKSKAGAWWVKNPQRALANNSAVYYKKPSVGEFLTEWGLLYESKSGERGIVNMDNMKNNDLAPRRDTNKIAGKNPCGEIALRPYQFCNLTEVIIEENDTEETLLEKVEIATMLGTIQASFTNFRYLRKIWQQNCEEERLLGVSLTGQFGNKLMSGGLGFERLGDTLDLLREKSIDTNATIADAMGINRAAAITTVKPSGTVSQLTGTSSGMHPWHSAYYIRSVRQDNKDPLTRFLKDAGVPNEPDVMKPVDTTVFYFPTKAPEGAVTRTQISAIDHLEFWKVYKQHWTEHDPSITISVKEDEWIGVANWVYSNWDIVGGISFLPYSDHTYQQAPYQETDESGYNQFVADSPEYIDWSILPFYESEDNTSGTQTLSCVSGSCELVGSAESIETIGGTI